MKKILRKSGKSTFFLWKAGNRPPIPGYLISLCIEINSPGPAVSVYLPLPPWVCPLPTPNPHPASEASNLTQLIYLAGNMKDI